MNNPSVSGMEKRASAEKAFKDWYYKHGEDWNAAHIKPVWMAAYAAAKESCAKVCDEKCIPCRPLKEWR